MLVVGLTGGIGSGKSTVADAFAALGVPVVDTDVIARELTVPGAPALAAIRAAFGDAVMHPDGQLDRAAMRRRVFADADARRQLEALLHPRIRTRVEQALAAIGPTPYVLVVIPLLVETGAYRELLDRVLVVDCPRALQVERVQARSGLDRAEVDAILAAQVSREARRAAADDILPNTASHGALAAEVARLHRRYLELAATAS